MPAQGPPILVALAREAAAFRRAGLGPVAVIGPAARRLDPGAIDTAGGLVVVAGVGGGLAPALAAGDVVVDGVDPALAERCGARAGAIHTADAVLSTPQDKARVFERTGALAVDMEQAVVARALAGRAAVVGVRAVMDTAAETLPAFAEGLVADDGTTRGRAVAARLLRSPASIGPLLRMGSASGLALGRAAGVLRPLLDALSAEPAAAADA